MIDGMLNIYKEQGFTSHDAVAKLRGILHQKKIGHTGTLDPMATGVLPICLGKGTRLCNMITDHDKEYVAELVFGLTTDTQDITGKIIKDADIHVDKAALEDLKPAITKTVMSFIGEQDQIPPMYSAKKINGEKLYEIARRGEIVERKASRITIKNIVIEDIFLIEDRPASRIRVLCSKGTYIRTLCEDIGNKFGTGACMTSLLRTRVGDFTFDKAITLSEVEKLVSSKSLNNMIISVEDMLPDYEKIVLTKDGSRLAYNGNYLNIDNMSMVPQEESERLKIYNSEGVFMAIYEKTAEKGTYKPYKMFL